MRYGVAPHLHIKEKSMFYRLLRYVRWYRLMRRFERSFGKFGKVPF